MAMHSFACFLVALMLFRGTARADLRLVSRYVEYYLRGVVDNVNFEEALLEKFDNVSLGDYSDDRVQLRNFRIHRLAYLSPIKDGFWMSDDFDEYDTLMVKANYSLPFLYARAEYMKGPSVQDAILEPIAISLQPMTVMVTMKIASGISLVLLSQVSIVDRFLIRHILEGVDNLSVPGKAIIDDDLASAVQSVLQRAIASIKEYESCLADLIKYYFEED